MLNRLMSYNTIIAPFLNYGNKLPLLRENFYQRTTSSDYWVLTKQSNKLSMSSVEFKDKVQKLDIVKNSNKFWLNKIC